MGGLLSFTAYQLLPSAGQVLYNAVYCTAAKTCS